MHSQQESLTKTAAAVAGPPVAKAGSEPREICDIFRQGMQLEASVVEQIKSDVSNGAAFFSQWNESRLGLAFESFDTSMKYALFEIIYLLNTNDPKYKKWKYAVFEEGVKGEETTADQEVDLYVEGAPCGVKGICSLSTVFRAEFDEYVSTVFGDPIAYPDSEPEPSIEGIYSIGSIGTVGHKNIDSDLDLQIQYYLQPYPSDTGTWDDQMLLTRLKEEQSLLAGQALGIDREPSKGALSDKEHQAVTRKALQAIHGKYPILTQHFFSKNRKFFQDIVRKNNQRLRNQLIDEIIQLMRFYPEMADNIVIKQKEALLKDRIQRVQDYVNLKFPEAEIYLFSFSRQELQQGYFGSTLDSKESSGGAYELILNYETLLPGIYFTSVTPGHFLFSTDTNNNPAEYERYSNLVRFGLVPGLEEKPDEINFQGPTPDLDSLYVARHSAAAYWEAFKGSSGNLPKATLNLLRFEMLLEPKFCKTNIQIVKQPDVLDEFAERDAVKKVKRQRTDAIYPLSDLFFPEEGDPGEAGDNSAMLFPVSSLLAFEEKHEGLKLDPWWLRYKSVKIGYCRAGLVSGVLEEHLASISNSIDLSFALHIRVSDVFQKPAGQSEFPRHRETVLADFLETVFPEESAQRNRLHAIFIGDVKTVNEFEQELRFIFQNSVARIHFKVSGLDLNEDKESTKEVEIWYHYYKKSFKAEPNVIQKSILSHLQTPRGRLQIGFQKKIGWIFRSLQKQSSRGGRFSSSLLDLLPDEIILGAHRYFLNGLVHCVINGYYGVFNRGKLNETKTAVEFDQKNMKLPTQLDDSRAYVRPDQVERIMKTILDTFLDRKVSYLDCIQEERVITEMMIFLNLLNYGLLSVMSRDNLNVYYVDQIKIPGFRDRAQEHVSDYEKMLADRELHIVLQKFLMQKKINIYAIAPVTWVNPNSVETNHAMTQYEAKEKMLAETFREIILKAP